MPTLEVEVIERNAFLGEIETELVGMQHHRTKLHPGEQVNLERESENAIRVENGRFDAVGYLPQAMASWLVPLIDNEQIDLDGYVPLGSDGESDHCPVNLMVLQSERAPSPSPSCKVVRFGRDRVRLSWQWGKPRQSGNKRRQATHTWNVLFH